ncbi:hypothetical protein HOB94_02205 [bacterium]|nr:hypothetical protein [bacterium]MBT4632801.1 hypothetical protein [bacterium]MBT6778206.1 hypothetical protein [bacterium]
MYAIKPCLSVYEFISVGEKNVSFAFCQSHAYAKAQNISDFHNISESHLFIELLLLELNDCKYFIAFSNNQSGKLTHSSFISNKLLTT